MKNRVLAAVYRTLAFYNLRAYGRKVTRKARRTNNGRI